MSTPPITATTVMQDLDPSRRPGAGPDGYAVLKMHPFFKGIDWKNLRGQSPPKLAREAGVQSSEGEDVNDSSWNPSHIGDGSARQADGNCGAASSSEGSGHITRLASIDSFDSKWQQFLDPGESVLMISMVKKLQKLTSKKVQLILTNKPKLIYVDPSKLIVKGNIIWSDNPNDLSIQVTSPTHFKICTCRGTWRFSNIDTPENYLFNERDLSSTFGSSKVQSLFPSNSPSLTA
uniref:PDK1-type PH domain-containing protein n=1 Tax=Fagus sylvatica TaxID=28930 RepID=A0A2N9IDH7_FAGSY